MPVFYQVTLNFGIETVVWRSTLKYIFWDYILLIYNRPTVDSQSNPSKAARVAASRGGI